MYPVFDITCQIGTHNHLSTGRSALHVVPQLTKRTVRHLFQIDENHRRKEDGSTKW